MVRNYQNADCSLRKQFIVSFIINSGTISFHIAKCGEFHPKWPPEMPNFSGKRQGKGLAREMKGEREREGQKWGKGERGRVKRK